MLTTATSEFAAYHNQKAATALHYKEISMEDSNTKELTANAVEIGSLTSRYINLLVSPLEYHQHHQHHQHS
jgi:hypothetical protein